jgi:hypothetical protein
MTKNTIRKSLAIVTAVTVWASAVSPALAVTAEELLEQIQALQAQLNALMSQYESLTGGETPTVTGCTITSFDRNLKQGMSGDDVKCLQIVLNTDTATKLADSGAGSPGNETSYFGPITKAAVIKFQEKYASSVLAPWGLTAGTGFVGSTTRAKLNEIFTAGGEVPSDGEVGTAAKVMLASDTPAAAQVALGSQDAVFTKLKFTAGADAYTVSKVVVARGGVSADQDISSIKLYDGSTQVGSTQALNTNTHKATFSSLSFQVPSYGVKYLTIKASIAAQNTATVGDAIQLGIASASDITSTVSLAGTFPMMGSAKTIAGISVGEVWVDALATPADADVLSGATDQEIACWRISASSSEGIALHSLTVSHVGTAARGDVSNLKLKVIGTQIGSTVAELDSSNQATFDLSSDPYEIVGGGSKTVCAYADIASGIWTERTVIFEITQYTDITAYGSNSGGAIIASYDDTTAFSKQTGSTMTISQGTLAVALDNAENPSAQSYVKGTTDRDIIAVKFTTGATEGVRLTKIRFTLTGAATDISNFTLWDGSTQIAGPASAVSGYVTFGANTIGWDTTGIFDLEKSSNKTLLVKADIPTGATALNEVSLALANSNVWADGLDSQYDVPSDSITGSASGNTHTISAEGDLAVSLSSDSPASQTYVKGSTEKVFTKINLTAASGEDILVSSIKFYCYTTSGQTTACTSGTTTNVKLLKSDGTQYGSTVANPAASATFSGNLTIEASETETLSLVADIPTGSGASYLHFDIKSATVEDDITSTGASSGADIDETGSATGKTMTVGTGSLTISAAATPADQTRIVGAANLSVLGLVMTAGTGEDVRVSSIELTGCTSDEGSTTDISNIALYDGDTRLTSKKNPTASSTAAANYYVRFSASDFLNSTGITLTKGQQKTITVKLDVPTTGLSGHDIALGIREAADVVATGLSSNTSLSADLTAATGNLTGVNFVAAGHIDAYELTLTSAGVLTINTSADTPLEQIQSVSIQGVQIPGVSFLKTYFAATWEQINMKSITIERKGSYSRDSDFASISLYDGDGNLLAGPQTLSNASTTFNFVEGSYWTIPTVGTKNLIVKATLNGIKGYQGYGSLTGDVPQLCIDNTTAQGVDSGTTPASGAGVPSTAICGNVQIIRQGQPTIALASPTTGTYGAGQKELIRWTVSADNMSSIAWRKVVFDVSGSVTIGDDSYTVGSSPDSVRTSGIYMSTSTTWCDAIATQLIATSSMQVWDADTNSRVTASSTNDISVDQATATGTARVAFVASSDQVIAADGTKTYYLIGNVLQGGTIGDNLLTKIEARSTGTTTDIYATVAGTDASLVWSDKSGASSGAHSTQSADWTNDYKVSGIPTATKTLSK